MIITETKLQGAFVIEPETVEDERGSFAELWTQTQFEARGLESHFIQGNVSYNRRKGTLRGLHYQAAPHGQAKLVRCTRGAVFDVALDLRPKSPTFKQWTSVELSEENRFMLYLPGDCAHGFQTLVDDSEVFYMVSTPYVPASGRGCRWNDPAFGIDWPDVADRILIERDQDYPDFII